MAGMRILIPVLVASVGAWVGCSSKTSDGSGSSDRDKDGQAIAAAEDGTEAGGDRAGLNSGTDARASECAVAADCPEAVLYDCIGRTCVLKRWSNGSIWFAGGGGETRSLSFRARLTVGARQPAGKTKSSNYILSLGPNHRRHN